ncbi:hypothetical protein ACI2KS_12470, partial [Pseudomonas sp. NPDC087358]|uniref:hypothetical protein n=1 Tax=Pseudomonas sp. NPDC087358 TaxID=3364439 RepID=UPI0038504585
DSTAFGQNQKQAAQQGSIASARRPSDATRFCPKGVGVGLPTIWREAPAKPVHAMYLTYRAV